MITENAFLPVPVSPSSRSRSAHSGLAAPDAEALGRPTALCLLVQGVSLAGATGRWPREFECLSRSTT